MGTLNYYRLTKLNSEMALLFRGGGGGSGSGSGEGGEGGGRGGRERGIFLGSGGYGPHYPFIRYHPSYVKRAESMRYVCVSRRSCTLPHLHLLLLLCNNNRTNIYKKKNTI